MRHFSDASQWAYEACTYIRMTDVCGRSFCAFVIGKSRLAPLKQVSIPRLELTAAVLAVKLDKMLRKELKSLLTDDSVFWCDSTAVLSTIANPTRRFPVFVANRVAIIERDSELTNWRYVPTKLNSADVATRCTSPEAFAKTTHWFFGPDFLYQPETNWPQNIASASKVPIEFLPLQMKVAKSHYSYSVNDSTNRLLARYSSYAALLKATCWLLRFKLYLLAEAKNVSYISTPKLCVEEKQVAEAELNKYVQRCHFETVINALNSNKHLSHRDCSQSLIKLKPTLHDNVLRVGGRLDKVPIDWDVRYPIILLIIALSPIC